MMFRKLLVPMLCRVAMLSAGVASATFVINEVAADIVGVDALEFVELLGDPNLIRHLAQREVTLDDI